MSGKPVTKYIILKLSTDKGFGSKLATNIAAIVNKTDLATILDVKQESINPEEIISNIKHPVYKAVKFVFVMPEFNGSFPAPFKALVDNLGWPNYLKDKNVFLVGYSGSFSGNLLGTSHMKHILEYVGANVPRPVHLTYNGNDEEIYNKESQLLRESINKFKE